MDKKNWLKNTESNHGTCETCKVEKVDRKNIGIWGINDYFICMPCYEIMTPEEDEKLGDWLCNNA